MELNYEKIKKELEISLDDSIEEKFENLSEIFNKEIEMSKLFVSCYDILNINLEKCNDDFKSWFKDFESVYLELRNELKDYENGKGFGDWAIEERIKNIVTINRYSLIKFLETFKNIFIE